MLGLGGGNSWSGMEGLWLIIHRWAVVVQEESRSDIVDKGSVAQAASAGQLG